jgi:hypothetical protein
MTDAIYKGFSIHDGSFSASKKKEAAPNLAQWRLGGPERPAMTERVFPPADRDETEEGRAGILRSEEPGNFPASITHNAPKTACIPQTTGHTNAGKTVHRTRDLRRLKNFSDLCSDLFPFERGNYCSFMDIFVGQRRDAQGLWRRIGKYAGMVWR